MFGWAIFFLIIALIAGILGFGGIAAISVEFATIIFVVALALLVISLIAGVVSGRRPPPV